MAEARRTAPQRAPPGVSGSPSWGFHRTWVADRP
eukprot:CAMPEP_0185288514 /NCGR_PEP_ID=MMETSP1363-20130426/3445_1 /TAXON_ID=38817 /ORGANISM="Gephyrocapsa oceanica, Strain RCC1303" /LENGTH=33 /DNA_ID= /DNA_START= /DNA_END= /DNA_ORIENTATION=